MDGYPVHYVSHNIPFVILFGLESDNVEIDYPLLQEKGIYISSDLPNVGGQAGRDLLDTFRDFDARDAAWNNRPGKGKMGTMGFTYRSVGRALTLPPHKAKSPSRSPTLSAEDEGPVWRSSLTPVLHSPISPLTPGSPTFADGIMTSLWFAKHQALLPSTIISFFNFTLDPNSSILHDNKLKSEINAMKSALASSAYKIRFVVVLVCQDNEPDIDTTERVANIRRATALDSKSLFYQDQGLSSVERRAFVGTVLASIQPSCIEYYRGLSKHARRKRNRGSIPPPTAPPVSGTSKTLSSQSWTVRYETKLGCFAEFRQEMDTAGRSYEAAYELLLDGEVFESISSWSPRFDEARLLADALAIRILRCLLWAGQTTSSVQSWSNHRIRMQDLVNRRGKGSGTYGWMAWEARWSAVMAELIERVDVPIFHTSSLVDVQSADIPDIYAIPEKAFASEERLPPWDLLHHEGYWFTRAANCTRARRKLATVMPKEDRSLLGQSLASQIASQSHLYDTYLCPEPHYEYALPGNKTFDYTELLASTLVKSVDHFSMRHQNRAVERGELAIAGELMRAGRWNDAMDRLKPIWQKLSWRHEGWWQLVEEVSWAIRACARNIGEGSTLVAVEWELMSDSLSQRKDWQYNFPKCLDGLDIEEKPEVVVDFGAVAPTLSATFVFGSREARVGEILVFQLSVSSHAHKSSSPIELSEIIITFEGDLKSIVIEHNSSESPIATSLGKTTYLYNAGLQENMESSVLASAASMATKTPYPLKAPADLSFAPGITKIFMLETVPRNAGPVKASQATISIREELFDFDLAVPLHEPITLGEWWSTDGQKLSKKKIGIEHAWIIEILPKPPKIQIELSNLQKAYYTDEQVEIQIIISNNEEEYANVSLDVKLIGTRYEIPDLKWTLGPDESDDQQKGSASFVDPIISEPIKCLISRTLGRLAPSTSQSQSTSFRALSENSEYVLEIKALYHLESDPDTPISKIVTKDLVVIAPFEASCDTFPRINTKPWPSYFHIDDVDIKSSSAAAEPNGLEQNWSLLARIASFALERLVIEDVSLEIATVRHAARCRVLKSQGTERQAVQLEPNEVISRTFLFEVQKLSIEDRRSSTLGLRLYITWRRDSLPPQSARTSLNIPSITIPFGEPRVLATAHFSVSPIPFPLVHLSYTLENPSAHLLTFSITMEASEDFAFNGPKAVNIQLVPLSRHVIRYNLLPTHKGVWIWPVLKVQDVGFGKILKVGAGEGCKADKKGLGVGIWVNTES